MSTQPAQTTQSSTQHALKPLYFPAITRLDPADHYAGGVPIRAVEDGLQGIVPAWQTMSIGDKVEVFWVNVAAAVWSKTIEHADELDKDVSFNIPEGFVLDGDAAPVFHRVTRKSQTPEDSTPPETFLVKRTRPGEYDEIPGDDGHSGFQFSLDRAEVDETLPPQGVTMSIVPYKNLTKYDRILARWGSQQVVHVVRPEQAADPVANPIDIVFSRALIEAAGDGPRVAIAFQVVDRCGNYPDERAPWSAIFSMLVDLGGNRLSQPLVLVNGLPTNSVDLDELGNEDVTVRVYTPANDFAVNDKVFLTWIGTPAQGPQIIVGPLERSVEFVPFQLDFPIPNAKVKAIAKGSASVGYVRSRSGEADRPSKNASVAVVGAISQLIAPTVVEAPGGFLPPDTLWATVNIPWYPGRNDSDLVNLIWLARGLNGDPVYYDDPRPVGNLPENQPILRSVSNAEIQRFNGLAVKVYYVVTNSETALLSVRDSLPFNMQVGEALPVFDRPEVEGDDNGALDPDKVPPTGATLVVPYLGTLDKDRVSYRWRGSAIGGSTSGYVNLIPATAGKEVKLTVDKQYVTINRDGTVVADYSIQRGGVPLGSSRELSLRIGVVDSINVEFLNGPYSVASAAQVKDIQLSLTKAGQPIAGTIKVTLPAGTLFNDGTGGNRDFPTLDGTLTISGVRAANTSGTFSLTASSGTGTTTATLTIFAYGPARTIALNPKPIGVTFTPDGMRAWVTGDQWLQVIDTTNSRVTNQVSLPRLDHSYQLVFSKDGAYAYVCNLNGAVWIVNTDDFTVLAEVYVTGRPIGIALSKDYSLAFVSTFEGNTVVVLDTASLKIVKIIPTNKLPRELVVTADGRQLWIANQGDDRTITIIDIASLSIIRTIPTPQINPFSLAFNPDGKTVYVCGYNEPTNGSIAEYDVQTFTQLRIMTTPPYPKGLVTNHIGNRLYFVEKNLFYTVDVPSFKVIATEPIGILGIDIAISPDNSRAYVSDINGASVSVIITNTK